MKYIKYFESSKFKEEELFQNLIDEYSIKEWNDYPGSKLVYDKNGTFLFGWESDKWCRCSYQNFLRFFVEVNFNMKLEECYQFIQEMIKKYFGIDVAKPSWKSGPEN